MLQASSGDSPATIRRHYAHWTRELQSRHDSLVRVIHDTSMAQAEDRISKECIREAIPD